MVTLFFFEAILSYAKQQTAKWNRKTIASLVNQIWSVFGFREGQSVEPKKSEHLLYSIRNLIFFAVFFKYSRAETFE